MSPNINTELVLERPEWEHVFSPSTSGGGGGTDDSESGSREVGGEVSGVEELRSDGVYFVRRDIK